MIKVRDLYFSYGRDKNYAVSGVSFEVEKGEILGFLGPNGAGKSTMQKILTGLLPVQQGEVTVAGHDMRRPGRDLFNKIGVSFEIANNYHKLSGLENLAFFASMYEVPTADPMALLRMVGLEDAATRRAGAYSKGMSQRLVFARSMLNRPTIWFLDEPTSGQDPAMTQRVKEIVLEERERGVTVFLTTHNMQVAEDICDRVAFINEGKIVDLDTPRNLKLRYGEQFVIVEYRDAGQLKKQIFSMGADKDRAALAALVGERPVETIHSQEATLEEVFIKVTGRALRG
ncbi:MAG: ABC transporter ATP-binding protein [Bacillota bacterium]|nr:ABC transporter ATP-binding protein [Bacillota bacterium]